MKQLAAIFLLLIFLFNSGGFRLWYYLEEQRSDIRMSALLDKEEFDDTDLVTIKIPLSLPYQADWKEFEKTDGEIEIEGTIYRFVKRKVQHGELVLLCLPHHDKMQLHTARDDFYKYANELAKNCNSNKSSGKQASNFNNPLSDLYFGPSGFLKKYFQKIQHDFKFPYQAGNSISVPHISPEQPPDNNSSPGLI